MFGENGTVLSYRMRGMYLVLELLSLRLISFQTEVSTHAISRYQPCRQERSVVLQGTLSPPMHPPLTVFSVCELHF